jgi:hypothetical protein
MIGFPNGPSETSPEFDQQIVNSAADPLFVIPKNDAPDPDPSKAVQTCLDMKAHSKGQQ